MKKRLELGVCYRLAVIAAAVLLEGCMWSRIRLNEPEIVVRARDIKPGVTTAAELSTILGAQPTRRTCFGQTVVYEYSYSDAKSKGLSLILVNFSRTENVTETLYVETDAQTGFVTRLPPLVLHEPAWRWWPFDDE